MRIVKYELYPEAYGSEGRFVTKESTLVDLIIDTAMLLNSDYDKKIPDLVTMNTLLQKGYVPRAGGWEPFEISQEEYEELVKHLCSLPLSRPYRKHDNT